MTPSERLGRDARYLDADADTLPYGLIGTPFAVVYSALRIVAASVWNVDPSVYRAGVAWGWYLRRRRDAFSAAMIPLVRAALVSECAPAVYDGMTLSELLSLLAAWMEYSPTFACMEALFACYGAVVDVRAISDPESQTVAPVSDKRLAYYIRVLEVGPYLTVEDVVAIALRTSPIGARPFVYLVADGGTASVPVSPADDLGAVMRTDEPDPAVSPVPVMPAITFLGDSTYDHWLYANSSMSGEKILGDYQSTLLYPDPEHDLGWSEYPKAIVAWTAYNDQEQDLEYLDPVAIDSGGVNLLGCKNMYGSTLYVKKVKIAQCSSTDATVVMVNTLASYRVYNAFKYTANGTDYYYVFDGTQTDWVTDLSSIGYRLVKTAYFKAGEGNSTVDSGTISGYGDTLTMYPLNSSDTIPVNQSYTYHIIRIFKINGNASCYITNSRISTSSGYLRYNAQVSARPTGKWCGVLYRERDV